MLPIESILNYLNQYDLITDYIITIAKNNNNNKSIKKYLVIWNFNKIL